MLNKKILQSHSRTQLLFVLALLRRASLRTQLLLAYANRVALSFLWDTQKSRGSLLCALKHGGNKALTSRIFRSFYFENELSCASFMGPEYGRILTTIYQRELSLSALFENDSAH